MSYSVSALKRLRKVAGLAFREDGRIDTRSLGNLDACMVTLRILGGIQKEEENFLRFEMGRVVNTIPDPKRGDRKKLILKLFGPARYGYIRNLAWVASRWEGREEIGWEWAFYKDLANFSLDVQNECIKLYKLGGFDVATMRQKIALLNSSCVPLGTYEQPELGSTLRSPLQAHVEHNGVSLTAYKQQGSLHIHDGDGTLVATWATEHLALLQQIVAQAHCIPDPDDESEEDGFAEEE